MKKIIVIILVIALMMCMAGCVEGMSLNAEENTAYKILLNIGSCFVYTFQDVETGVWYLSTSEGITPRLNADGSLYVSEVE